MKLQVKKSAAGGSAQHEIEVTDTSITVLEFKQMLSPVVGLPWERIRLVAGGRVFENNYPLSEYGVNEGMNIHCLEFNAPLNSNNVPSAMQVPTAAGSQMFGGMGEDEVAAMMNNPMMDALFSNPEMMQAMMRMNPQMNELMENNPEMARILNDPETLQQSMQMMRNPALMREAQRNWDRGMWNLNTMPGGEDALRRLHEDVVDPLTDALSGGGGSSSGGGANANGDMSRYTENRTQGPTSAAMPNPFAPNRNAAAGGAGATAAGTPAAGAVPGRPAGGWNPMANPMMNPMFAQMMGGGMPPAGGSAAGGAQPNPFAAMFGGMPPPGGAAGAGGAPPPNPFAAMFGGMPPAGGAPLAAAAPARPDTSREPTAEEFKLVFKYNTTADITWITKRSNPVGQVKEELEHVSGWNMRAQYIRFVRSGTVLEDTKSLTEYIREEDVPAAGEPLLKIFVLKNVPQGDVEERYVNPNAPANPLAALFGGGAPGGAGASPFGGPFGGPMGGAGGANPLAALLGGGMGAPMGGGMGMGGMGGGFPAGGVPPEQRYATQIEQLAGMGFVDRDQVIRVLTEVNGDFNRALDRLFGM